MLSEELERLRLNQNWIELTALIQRSDGLLESHRTFILPFFKLALIFFTDIKSLVQAEFELETFISLVQAGEGTDEARKTIALRFDSAHTLSPGIVKPCPIANTAVEKLETCVRLATIVAEKSIGSTEKFVS
jgi:hypothetical protein